MRNNRQAFQVISGRLAIVIAFLVFLFGAINSYSIASNPVDTDAAMMVCEDDGGGAAIYNALHVHQDTEVKQPSGPRHKKHYYLHSKNSRKEFVRTTEAGGIDLAMLFACDQYCARSLPALAHNSLPVPGYYEALHLLTPF